MGKVTKWKKEFANRRMLSGMTSPNWSEYDDFIIEEGKKDKDIFFNFQLNFLRV